MFAAVPQQRRRGAMMRVDFYQRSLGPPEAAIALLARKILAAGERLLVVAGDERLLASISEALWTSAPASFLAHGMAGGPHDARQPILLAHEVQSANGARVMVLADGVWREPSADCARILYLFDGAGRPQARECWAQLGQREGIERRYWRQDQAGRWIEGP